MRGRTTATHCDRLAEPNGDAGYPINLTGSSTKHDIKGTFGTLCHEILVRLRRVTESDILAGTPTKMYSDFEDGSGSCEKVWS